MKTVVGFVAEVGDIKRFGDPKQLQKLAGYAIVKSESGKHKGESHNFTGNMDTCISIRLAYKKNGKVIVHSGAGIVADSVPENEYMECINKAAAVLNAVRDSEGGIE